MTRDQLDAIRARVEAGPARALVTQIEIDRDGTTRWVHIGPYLCFTHEDAAKVRDVVSFVHHAPTDLRALLAEVERLTADPLPAAAWVREVERAAFQRGVAAMREAAAKECWNASDELADIPDMETEQGTLQNVAYRIRAIPDPEDKP